MIKIRLRYFGHDDGRDILKGLVAVDLKGRWLAAGSDDPAWDDINNKIVNKEAILIDSNWVDDNPVELVAFIAANIKK